MSKSISQQDLESHKTPESGGIWIAIEGDVYDVTNFVDEHPGGAKILKRVGGKDATKQFWKVSKAQKAQDLRTRIMLLMFYASSTITRAS